ncbi:O-antigen ligase family protein [Flavihumibacter stibioxidans]|uniref:O-antigen ligase-related domain-containing protein n=1 Tax=Flavihumibacter stibioxidans TaxID=1834163 RepID=A0ABR7M845_9BACT|nr:O-antigen ligase family protein [Flavihumibacter stibioxidans]MBC6490791.1 hypothetical protein [Flavihumibacter stibioxidans]
MLNYLILKDANAGRLSKKEAGYYIALVIFFITLFMGGNPVINNIAIGLLFVYTWTINSLKDKWEILRAERSIWLMIGFFLLHLVSLAWTGNKAEAGVMLGLRSPLIIFPLSLGLTRISQFLRERALVAFVMITTMVALLCLGDAVLNWKRTGDSGFMYNDSLSGLVEIQSIYLAMMVNIALFSIAWLITRDGMPSAVRSWLYLSLVVLLPFHFLLASRMAILILYTAAAIFLAWKIVSRRLVLEGVTLVMGLVVVGFLLLKFSPKTFNRFRELGYTGYDIRSEARESHYNSELTADQWNGANIRLAVWDCGIELAKNNMLLGTGLGDKMDELMKVYETKGFSFGVKANRNLHNNYLDAWVTFGLAGLVLMVFGWILLPMRRALRAGNFWGAIVIASFALSFISESYFDRSIGVITTCFFICFVGAAAAGQKKAA